MCHRCCQCRSHRLHGGVLYPHMLLRRSPLVLLHVLRALKHLFPPGHEVPYGCWSSPRVEGTARVRGLSFP